MDRRAWWATVHGVPRVRHDLVTKPIIIFVNVIIVCALFFFFWSNSFNILNITILKFNLRCCVSQKSIPFYGIVWLWPNLLTYFSC